MPKVDIGINDISAAAIGSTVGSGASDITFTFKSALVTLGSIEDTADSFSDGSTNGGKALPMWVEVVNNTGSNIDLSADYYIDITADAVSYRLHFPEQILVPSTTYIWYFDKQGIAFTDSDLVYPAVDIHDIDNEIQVVDDFDDGISDYQVVEDVINKVDFVEEYQRREVVNEISIEETIDREPGLSVLQTIGHLLTTIGQGILWQLKTATTISWRLK